MTGPYFDLTGKVAMVTGGSRGLGYQMVRAFAEHGADIIVAGLIEASYAKFGKVDILVNNAGSGPRMASHDVTESLFDSVLNLNFKGPFRLASQVAKRMADGAGGSIINISSSGSLVPLPMVVPYGSAKAALNAMSLSLAHEYAPKVRVNTICPGPFLTDISRAWPEEMRQSADNAMRRPGLPHEIITAALYLASPSSSFTTGSLLRVDGSSA